MPDRFLWIQTSSGLASRMRAVVGALAYCKATDRRLIVDWPHDDPSETLGCFPAKFHDLWSNADIEATDCKQRFRGLRPDSGHLLETDAEDLRFRTCHIEPFLKWIPDHRPGETALLLQPSTEVSEHIDTMLKLLTNSYFVGVNIRHALKQPNVASVDWFVDRMKSFHESVQFYASLDSKEVSDRLLSEFPDRVLEINKDYVYDRDGIIKTCADLYLLAACDHLIGSNYSSYSQMAAFLRGAKYIGPHDKPEPGLECDDYEDLWNPMVLTDQLVGYSVETSPDVSESVAAIALVETTAEREHVTIEPSDVASIDEVLPELKEPDGATTA